MGREVRDEIRLWEAAGLEGWKIPDPLPCTCNANRPDKNGSNPDSGKCPLHG
jgi:hypothetical protein